MDHQYDIWSPLPGAIQTVPRAELYALLIVVHHVRPNALVHFFTGNKNTRDTYYKGQSRAALAANAYMWGSLFHQIEAKSRKVHVYWMPSHTDTEPAKLEKAPQWLKPWHVLGNNKADKLADLAANLHNIPRYQAKPVLEILNMQSLIQKRLVAVIKSMPPRRLRAEAMQIPKKVSRHTAISRLLTKSSHPASIHKNRVVCHQCKQSMPIRAPQVPDFLATTCHPPDQQWSVAIGNRHTHPSHRLRPYGGVYICTRCGSVAREVIKNLGKPCINLEKHEEPTPGGKINLRAYAANRPPQGCKGWPYSSLDQMELCIRRRVQQAVNDLPPQYVPDVIEEEEEDGPSDAEDQPSVEQRPPPSLGESDSSSSD